MSEQNGQPLDNQRTQENPAMAQPAGCNAAPPPMNPRLVSFPVIAYALPCARLVFTVRWPKIGSPFAPKQLSARTSKMSGRS